MIENFLRENLNEEQFEACIYNGNSLILAAAGSGKTRTLTFKILYLLYNGIKPENILAVTFTKKAANEMQERLGYLINKINLKINIKKINLGTYHSVFLKFLKEEINFLKKINPLFNENFTIYDENDSENLLKQIIASKNLTYDINIGMYKIGNWKNECLTWQAIKGIDEYDYLYELYQNKLAQSNALDYDDILLYTYLILKTFEEVREKRKNKLKRILVDEAQDSNKIQFEILKLISNKIVFIGDDYQSIYGWRGAALDEFLKIPSYRKDIKIFQITTNYRSKSHIIKAAEYVILNNKNQFKKNLKPIYESDEKITIFESENDDEQAIKIIDYIQNNLKDMQVAILYRNNRLSQPIEQYLISQGIPYTIYGGFKFYERKEIKDILAYLKYIINPFDVISLKRIINVPNRKIGESSIRKLEELAESQNKTLAHIILEIERYPGYQPIKEFYQTIKFLKNQLNNLDISNFIQNLIKIIKYDEYLKNEGDEKADERMQNINQLINLATKYGKGHEGLKEFLEDINIIKDIEEKKETNIKLLTIHASKGLEFDYVFLIGLEDGVFPLKNSDIEEERRLMYVALTRAKKQIFLSYSKSRFKFGKTIYNKPSIFIDEIPDFLKNQEIKKIYKNFNYFEEGQIVYHPLYGKGKVLEYREGTCIVNFFNKKIGVRKVNSTSLKIIETN